MKYIVQFIVTLFFMLTIKAEEIHINNYFRLISDVHKYYCTFSVIFVWSGNYHNFNMTSLLHTWSRDFSRQRITTATITFTDLVSEYDEYQRTIARPLFVVLLDTGETMNEFVEVTKNVKPISFPVWLIVFLQCSGKPLEKYCRHPADNMFNVDFDTLMLVLCYDHPNLDEWYAIRDNRTRTFEVATWATDGSLVFKMRENNLYARRNDMFGDIIRVMPVNESAFFSMKNGAIDGFFGLLLIELSKAMNFTLEVLNPIDAYGGWNKREKKWTGVIGELVNGRADIGASAFTITADRLNFIDFTLPLIHSRCRLYFKQPTRVHWSGYFTDATNLPENLLMTDSWDQLKTIFPQRKCRGRPSFLHVLNFCHHVPFAFSYGIWIMLATVIIIASILLSIIKVKGVSMNLIFENYVHVWGIYCQQGWSEFSSKLSMRLAVLSIYVSSLIVTSAYSASLISFLTLTKTSLPFSTFEDYVKDGSYKLIAITNSAEYNMIHHMKTPMFLKMHQLLEEKKHLPSTLPEAFKQICERKNLALFTTELFKSAMNIYLTCKIRHIESGRTDSLAMALTKGNPYTGLMNYNLRRFQLNGVINKLKGKHFSRSNKLETNYNVVSLEDVAPTLTIMAGSIILALFILISEKMYHSLNIQRFKRTKLKNRDKFLVKNHKIEVIKNLKFQQYFE